MKTIWKQKDVFLRDIIVKVSTTLFVATVLAVTYPIYEYFKVPTRIYDAGITIAGFIMIWLIVSKIENRKKM